MRKFTVDRRTWNRGNACDAYSKTMGKPRLLNNQGYMCCLGFLGKACGISNKRMYEVSFPNYVELNKHRNYPLYNSEIWKNISSVNDNPGLCDDEREKRLKKKFLSIGFEVEFIG